MAVKNSISKMLFFLVLVSVSMNSYAQNQDYYYPPFEFSDIVKGLKDTDYFRAKLMEKGFTHFFSTETSEKWVVKTGNEPSLINVSLSSNKDEYILIKRAEIMIRRDLMSKYIAEFKNKIFSNFSKPEIIISKQGDLIDGYGRIKEKGYDKYIVRYTNEKLSINLDYSTELAIHKLYNVDYDVFEFEYFE